MCNEAVGALVRIFAAILDNLECVLNGVHAPPKKIDFLETGSAPALVDDLEVGQFEFLKAFDFCVLTTVINRIVVVVDPGFVPAWYFNETSNLKFAITSVVGGANVNTVFLYKGFF